MAMEVHYRKFRKHRKVYRKFKLLRFPLDPLFYLSFLGSLHTLLHVIITPILPNNTLSQLIHKLAHFTLTVLLATLFILLVVEAESA